MDNNIIGLLKIGKREHQKHIYGEGQFYMNTSKYFYTKAQTDETGLVYDLHESSFPRGVSIRIGETTLSPFHPSDDMATSMNLGANTCIFCFYAITKDKTRFIDGRYFFELSAEMIAGIVGDENPSDYEVVVIRKPDLIVQRIETKIHSLNIPVRTGMVKYDDHDFPFDFSEMLVDLQSTALSLCFHKCKRFAMQNEYRIAVVNSSDSPREDIVIGSLSSDEYVRYDIQSVNDPMNILF